MKTVLMSLESAAPGIDRTVDCGRYTTCLSSCMILTSAHAAASSKEPVIRPKWRYNDALTAIDPSSHGVSPSALRVRRHRERCRGGRCLFTIEVPEANSNTRSWSAEAGRPRQFMASDPSRLCLAAIRRRAWSAHKLRHGHPGDRLTCRFSRIGNSCVARV